MIYTIILHTMLPEIYFSFSFVSRPHDPGDHAFSRHTEPDVDLHEIKTLVFVLFQGRIL